MNISRLSSLLVISALMMTISCRPQDDSGPAQTPEEQAGGADEADEAAAHAVGQGDEQDGEGGQWRDVELPDTPAARRAIAYLSLLRDSSQPLNLGDFEDTFTEEFIAQVPQLQLLQITTYMATLLEGFRIERLDEEPTETELKVVLQNPDNTRFRFIIGVEAEEPHLVSTLLILHAPDLSEDTFGDVDSILDELREWRQESPDSRDVHVLAAELGDDACTPIFELNADLSLPIGSTFKLWVLGAAAAAVEAGALSWDQPVEISEAALSLGATELEPGSTVPLREVAELMIRVSDNTATDILMELAERRSIERWMTDARHSHAHFNMPMINTREMTVLKLYRDGEFAELWEGASPNARRHILGQISEVELAPLLESLESWEQPRAIRSVEWFANANDLCNTMLALRNLSEASDNTRPILEILGENPGLELNRERWPYIGYKGGSEPGVLSMAWLLLDSSNTWHVLILGLSDSAAPLPMTRFFAMAKALSDRVGATPQPR